MKTENMKHYFISRFIMLACVLVYCLQIVNLYAAVNEPGVETVKKCPDFKVTGDGSSEHWNKANWIILEQRSNREFPYLTKVKVLYSETGIYLLYDCQDTRLTTTMKADNLNLWLEDVVEAFFWTDETFPVYFEYEISPMNYELPIMVPNYKGNFFGWLPWHYEGDKKIQHQTSVTGGKKKSGRTVTGWKAEFFIPYKLLVPLNNVPPVSGTKWRANFYRIDYDHGQTTFSWQKTDKTFHEYFNFGTLVFE